MKVSSYNVLADAYLRPKWYAHIAPEHLDSAWRRPAVVKRVGELDADVVCLQEVETPVFAALNMLGYGGHHALKAGDKPEGCATLWRTDLLGDPEIRVLQFTDGTGHIALITRFDPLMVINTHLRWSDDDAVARGQIQEILDAAEGRTHVIVCGDFNAAPDSVVVEALLRRGFVDAYGAAGDAFTCNVNRHRRRIDFIFHTSEWTSQPGELPLIGDDTALPSAGHPSDHLAITAHLTPVL